MQPRCSSALALVVTLKIQASRLILDGGHGPEPKWPNAEPKWPLQFGYGGSLVFSRLQSFSAESKVSASKLRSDRAMSPRDWMLKAGETYESLAARWGYAYPSAIHKPVMGKEQATYRIIVNFEEASRGAVSLHDWKKLRRPDGERKKRKAKK